MPSSGADQLPKINLRDVVRFPTLGLVMAEEVPGVSLPNRRVP